jgi:hypothetical protein
MCQNNFNRFRGDELFKRCDFLLGQGPHSIVIVIPANLPAADTYTVSVSDRDIKFKVGNQSIAEMPYEGREIYERIANNTQIGLVEYPPGGGDLPKHITNVAYVEVRRAG